VTGQGIARPRRPSGERDGVPAVDGGQVDFGFTETRLAERHPLTAGLGPEIGVRHASILADFDARDVIVGFVARQFGMLHTPASSAGSPSEMANVRLLAALERHVALFPNPRTGDVCKLSHCCARDVLMT
jgi:hypothetical protein